MKIKLNSTSRHTQKGLTLILLMVLIFHMKDLKSQDYSTRGEIYDYEVGDIFHFSSEAIYYGPTGFQDVTNIEITGKYFSPMHDTINYIREIQNKRRDLINGNYGSWQYSNWNDTIFYNNLDSLIFKCYDWRCRTYTNSNYYNGRLINQYFEQFIEENIYERYVVGCGRAEFNLSATNNQFIDSVLVYYKKGSEEWGQQLTVGVRDQDYTEDLLSIFPNPTESAIRIKYDKPLIGKVIIYSQFGENIQNIPLKGDSETIDISRLKPSIYILEFILNDRVIVKRLIKR